MNKIRRRLTKDVNRRMMYKDKELKFIVFKYFRRELNVKNDIDLLFKYYLHYKFICWFKLNMSITRIRNYCLKTARSRWILRRFIISRITFKEYMRQGKLQGMRKM